MNTSRLSNLIFTARLVECFDETSLKPFKKRLLRELNYQNESQFFARIIRNLAKEASITYKVTHVLKEKAMSIAENQFVDNEQGNVTHIHQFVQKRYQDQLSQLPGPVVANISCYLQSKECIAIGHLNRQLFIQTQQKSHFTARKHYGSCDPPLKINALKVIGLFSMKRSFLFAYSFPYQVYLGNPQDNQYYLGDGEKCINKLKNDEAFINNIFCDLENIYIYDSHFLPIIPVNKLFSQNKNQHRRKRISTFGIICDVSSFVSVTSWYPDHLDQFVNNCQKFFEGVESISSVKKISNLLIDLFPQREIDDECTRNYCIRDLLVYIGPIYESLSINNCRLTMKDEKDTGNIFHSSVKSIELSTCCGIEMKENFNKISRKVKYDNVTHLGVKFTSTDDVKVFDSIVQICELGLLNKLQCIEFILADHHAVYLIDFCQKIAQKDVTFDYGASHDWIESIYSDYSWSGDELYGEDSDPNETSDSDGSVGADGASDRGATDADNMNHSSRQTRPEQRLKNVNLDGATFDLLKKIVYTSKNLRNMSTINNRKDDFTFRFVLKYKSSSFIQCPLILAYFIKLKQEKKDEYLNYVNYFEFVWKNDRSRRYEKFFNKPQGITKNIANRNLRDIFRCNNTNDSVTAQFDVDKQIVHYDFNLTEESCGILYRQLVDWFKRIYQKYGESGVKERSNTLRCRVC